MSGTKAALEAQFGTDAALGVWFLENTTNERLTLDQVEVLEQTVPPKSLDLSSYLPDNGSATQCTAYAMYARRQLGSARVQIYGFSNDENPDCDVVRQELHPCGHDFALVDGRYLLDPWVKLVVGEDWPPVYDLSDPTDKALARQRYGEHRAWTRMHATEQWADSHKEEAFY